MKTKNMGFISLILLSGLVRLFPHPWNFTPLLAACIFSGSKIKPIGLSIFVPLLAIFLGDMIIGFYKGMVWVYTGYILVIIISILYRKYRTLNSNLLKIFSTSLIFFIISNFGVWIEGLIYPLNYVGLFECYVAAIPFYKNTLIGTILYSGIFFGLANFIERNISSDTLPSKL